MLKPCHLDPHSGEKPLKIMKAGISAYLWGVMMPILPNGHADKRQIAKFLIQI
jgi:hypothetical protein